MRGRAERVGVVNIKSRGCPSEMAGWLAAWAELTHNKRRALSLPVSRAAAHMRSLCTAAPKPTCRSIPGEMHSPMHSAPLICHRTARRFPARPARGIAGGLASKEERERCFDLLPSLTHAHLERGFILEIYTFRLHSKRLDLWDVCVVLSHTLESEKKVNRNVKL